MSASQNNNIREPFITIDTLEFMSHTDGRISVTNTKTGEMVIEPGYYLVDINPNAVVIFNDPKETTIITFMTGQKKIKLIYTTENGYIKYSEEERLSLNIARQTRHIDKDFLGPGHHIFNQNHPPLYLYTIEDSTTYLPITYYKDGTIIFDTRNETNILKPDFNFSSHAVWFKLVSGNCDDVLFYYTKVGKKYEIKKVCKEEDWTYYHQEELCEIECDELLSVVGIQNNDQEQTVEITCIVKVDGKVQLITITKNKQTKEQKITYSRDLNCDEVVQTTINPCTYLLKGPNGIGILALDDDGEIKICIEPLYGDVITCYIDGEIVYCVIDKEGNIVCIKDNGHVIYGTTIEDEAYNVIFSLKKGYFMKKLKEKIFEKDTRVQPPVEKKPDEKKNGIALKEDETPELPPKSGYKVRKLTPGKKYIRKKI